LSNAPGAPELIFGSAFFPWPRPVGIAVGDTVAVTLGADFVGADYIWRWETRVLNQGHPGQVKASFKQSTFFDSPFSTDRLRYAAGSHTPTLNEEGRVNNFILGLMDGQSSLGTIARRVMGQFPGRFASYGDALTRVAQLSEENSR
jgi:type I protein arginine methyltransferase